jgi:predicted metal-dependent HD superfamily phosphohydrolase
MGAQGDGTSIFEHLASAYSESVRAYHNTEHLQHCLAELDSHPGLADRPHEVEAALWFHDAVYVPARSDNEDRSARLAGEVLRDGGVEAETTQRVGSLILATRHTSLSTDNDTRLVCDIDLAILGRTPAEFDRFESRIRQEYHRVPKPLYRHARTNVLRGFLLRPSIYQTNAFKAQYEAQARQNLERAVGALTG